MSKANPVDDELEEIVERIRRGMQREMGKTSPHLEAGYTREEAEVAIAEYVARVTPTPQLAACGCSCSDCASDWHNNCDCGDNRPAPQPAMGDEELRERIRLLYIESEKETDRPVLLLWREPAAPPNSLREENKQ